jgi:uncharacterized repeat protein (TIGR03803 family)
MRLQPLRNHVRNHGIATLICALLLSTTTFASGPVEQVLFSFLRAGSPNGGLVADSSGNLYGTTVYGGKTFGTVFELSPPTVAGDSWTETVIHVFDPKTTADGKYPESTLIFDPVGNLYGTTAESTNGWGSVFELSPPATAGGTWTEKLLVTFPRNSIPQGKLIFDDAGNLYGTTTSGGAGTRCGSQTGFGCGTVFKLKPPASPGASWTETVLHSFAVTAGDGFTPGTSLVLRNGALYGTTTNGGANEDGTIFQLARQNGVWVENILYNFSGSDGANPVGGLIVDSAGNFYGTAKRGGVGYCNGRGCGTAFELSPPAAPGDPWQETTLYVFPGSSRGGGSNAALIRDRNGNLYGTGTAGGFKNNGVVFKLVPPATAGGSWAGIVVHAFDPFAGDGAFCDGELILMTGKGLFGTTPAGGANDSGTVFNISL